MIEFNNDREIKLVHDALFHYCKVLLNDAGFLTDSDYEETCEEIEILSEIIGEMERKYEWIQNN